MQPDQEADLFLKLNIQELLCLRIPNPWGPNAVSELLHFQTGIPDKSFHKQHQFRYPLIKLPFDADHLGARVQHVCVSRFRRERALLHHTSLFQQIH